jgi:hypothetical protein
VKIAWVSRERYLSVAGFSEEGRVWLCILYKMWIMTSLMPLIELLQYS